MAPVALSRLLCGARSKPTLMVSLRIDLFSDISESWVVVNPVIQCPDRLTMEVEVGVDRSISLELGLVRLRLTARLE